jgi:hypothetical protein
VKVRTVRMDNEVLAVLTAMFDDQNLESEFVSPKQHHRNEAERFIRNGKN